MKSLTALLILKRMPRSGVPWHIKYLSYAPKSGLRVTLFDRETEQSRFEGSTEGATREQRGSTGKHGQAAGEHKGAVREQMDIIGLSARAQSVTCY